MRKTWPNHRRIKRKTPDLSIARSMIVQSLSYQLTSNESKDRVVLIYGDRIQVRKKVKKPCCSADDYGNSDDNGDNDDALMTMRLMTRYALLVIDFMCGIPVARGAPALCVLRHERHIRILSQQAFFLPAPVDAPKSDRFLDWLIRCPLSSSKKSPSFPLRLFRTLSTGTARLVDYLVCNLLLVVMDVWLLCF